MYLQINPKWANAPLVYDKSRFTHVVKREVILPVFRMMDGEDHPRVQVILFEGHQHSKLILAS